MGVLATVVSIGIIGYSIAWLIVALASDPTWWWFVPIYGDIQIFQESLWYGLFHIGIFPFVLIAGALFSD
jgi:hypothetical protein